MPVHFKGLSSNKVPLKPESPDEELFPTKLTMSDGSVIWRSVPLPDTIAFKAVLTKEHFGKKGGGPEFDPHCIAQLSEELAGAQEATTGIKPYMPKDGIGRLFKIALGPRESTLFVKLGRQKLKDFQLSAWTILFEMTPRKVQPQGMEEFLEYMHQGTPGGFDFPAVLRDARVMRLDIAVDYAGVEPADLIATIKKGGKRTEIFGSDGALETIWLHGHKAPPKGPLKKKPKDPLGTTVAKIYDRNRERQSVGKPPPYPGFSVTRLEVVKKRFGNKPLYLSDVASLADPFDRVRLSLGRRAHSPSSPSWMNYLAAVRALGRERAEAMLQFNAAQTQTFRKALDSHPSNLLGPGDVWPLWSKGLAITGLQEVIDVAKAAG